MYSRIFFAWFCCLSSMLMAGTTLSTTIVDGYYRANTTIAGSVSIRLDGETFDQITPEDPYYLRLSFDNGALNGYPQGPPFNDMIHLAMALTTQSATATMVAPADTITVVDWGYGQNNDIWIRINRPATEWIQDGETLRGLQEGEYVEVMIGIEENHLEGVEDRLKNMPFNTGSSAPNQVRDTRIWLQLQDSSLTFDGTETSYIRCVADLYESDAGANAPQYAPGTLLEDQPNTDLPVLRGKDVQVTVNEQHPGPTRIHQTHVAEGDLLIVNTRFKVALQPQAGPDLLTPYNSEFSHIFLEVPDDGPYAFVDNASEWQNRPDGYFYTNIVHQVDGRTHWKTLEGFPNRTDVGPLGQETWEFDIQLAISSQEALEEIKLDYTVIFGLGPQASNTDLYSNVVAYHGQFVHSLVVPPRILPHLTVADGDFTSQILLSNTNSEAESYNLAFFDESGTYLSGDEATLEANMSLTLSRDNLIPETAAYAQLLATDRLKSLVIYQANGVGKGPAHSQFTTTTAQRWRILPGFQELTYDAFAMVNAGDAPAEIQLQRIDAQGTVLETYTLAEPLPSRHKDTVILSNVLGPANGSFYEIISSQPISLLSLRGDWSSQFLWENPALVIE